MTTTSPSLEDQLRSAFVERADSYEARDSDRPPDARRRPKPRLTALAVAATLVIIAAVAIAVGLGSGTTRQPVRSTEPSTTTLSPPPPAVTGTELPLRVGSGPDVDFLLRFDERRHVPAPRAIVEPDGGHPVLIDARQPGCFVVADAPPEGTGYQETCIGPDQAGRAVGAVPNTGGVVGPTTVWYVVWSEPPTGTAYVTFDYGRLHRWQRPLSGVSCFTIPNSAVQAGAPPPILHAYDASGAPLASATVGSGPGFAWSGTP